MTTSRSLRIGAAALLALAGACSSDSTVPGGPAASLDQVFSEASLSSLSSISALTPVSPSLTAMPAPSDCTFSSGSFVCREVKISDLTLTRKFTLYDAHDVVQSQFVSGTTAKVKFESAAHGAVTSAPTNVAVDQVQTLVLSGLTTSTHFLNGTSTTTITDIAPAGSTPTVSTFVITFNNLELPRESGGYPGSGNIDLSISSTDVLAPPLHMRLAFNGTSKVTVTLTVRGAPLTCSLDLAVNNPTCS